MVAAAILNFFSQTAITQLAIDVDERNFAEM